MGLERVLSLGVPTRPTARTCWKSAASACLFARHIWLL